MRMLFTTTPGLGHFHPLVPLARVLVDAGHDVAFAGLNGIRPSVEAAGFPFLSVERGIPVQQRQLNLPQRTPVFSVENELRLHARMFGRILPSLMAPGLACIGRTWRPDLYIRESAEYGAVIAAEHLGIPHAAVSCFASLHGAALFERNLAGELRPACNAVTAIPAESIVGALHRSLDLVYSPPTFATHPVNDPANPAPIPAPIPPTTHFIRPEFFDGRLPVEPLEYLQRLPPRPTVYVTMGTEANGLPTVYPRILQSIIDALNDEPVNAIVTIGLRGAPADFPNCAPNVQLHHYIPQTALLPHCDLAILHGGSNTLLAAIHAGLPFILIPLIADQFFNADVTRRLNLGRVLDPANLSPATIRSAVAELLSNPAYRTNVQKLQTEMHQLPDQSLAVELIEKLATDRKPIEQCPLVLPIQRGMRLRQPP